MNKMKCRLRRQEGGKSFAFPWKLAIGPIPHDFSAACGGRKEREEMKYVGNRAEDVKIAYIGGGSRGWA